MNIEEKLNYAANVIQMLTNGFGIFVADRPKLPVIGGALENFLHDITLTLKCKLCKDGLTVFV